MEVLTLKVWEAPIDEVARWRHHSRIKIKGTKVVDKTKMPIPTTLLTNPLTDYCSKPKKILFILQKSDEENTYNKLFFEIKKDLFNIEKDHFSERVKVLLQFE